MDEKIVLYDAELDENITLYVMERTCINEQNYLLATEEGEGDGEAYIMKEVSLDDKDIVYEFVSDYVELEAISKVFVQMLEDIDIEL